MWRMLSALDASGVLSVLVYRSEVNERKDFLNVILTKSRQSMKVVVWCFRRFCWLKSGFAERDGGRKNRYPRIDSGVFNIPQCLVNRKLLPIVLFGLFVQRKWFQGISPLRFRHVPRQIHVFISLQGSALWVGSVRMWKLLFCCNLPSTTAVWSTVSPQRRYLLACCVVLLCYYVIGMTLYAGSLNTDENNCFSSISLNCCQCLERCHPPQVISEVAFRVKL